jgi:uncharacterized membrane protein HdeD (DUF308 family)
MRPVLVRNWWSIVFRGALGILFGLVTFAWPNITVGALVLLFGAYALVEGIVSIVGAALGGAASTIFGVLTAIAPIAGALAIAVWVGAYAFVFGLIMVALGFRLRNWRDAPQAGPPFPAPVH